MGGTMLTPSLSVDIPALGKKELLGLPYPQIEHHPPR